MGVYHLMGLGRSAGAVTSALSFLAHRYERWNESDREFFSRSGEVEQRESGKKVGGVQSLVLFTTREVISGKLEAFSYLDNKGGQPQGQLQPPAEMEKVLSKVLSKELYKFYKEDQRQAGQSDSGKKKGNNQKGNNRQKPPSFDIFWVEVDRNDTDLTYQRIIQVISALANVGGQGKELWVNLTGGTNVINFSLQLAATLSGQVARLYYTQAADAAAEQCIRFATEDKYWIELPLLPLDLTPLTLDTIRCIQEAKHGISQRELESRIKQEYSKELDGKNLEQYILVPLWKQGLVSNSSGVYTIGPRWEPIEPYAKWLEENLRREQQTLEQLSKDSTKPWLTRQTILLEA
jgi:hypothetical protein